MAGGRPPGGARLVDGLEGSPGAKKRLRMILETLAGERTVQSACDNLGVSQARFHKLRSKWLQEALKNLEPKPQGRPPKKRYPEEEQTEELQNQLKMLEIALRAAEVREEIAVSLPHLAGRHRKGEKKTKS
jgi:transposase-like protein